MQRTAHQGPTGGLEQNVNAFSEALSVAEFCRRYGIGRSMAYEEHRRGRLKFRKVGSRTLIMIGDAESWASSLPEVAA